MAVDVTALAIKVESSGIKEASHALGGLSTSANNAEKRVAAFTVAMDKLNAMSRISAQGVDTFMAKMAQNAVSMQGFNTNVQASLASIASLATAINQLSTAVVVQNVNIRNSETSHRRNNEAMREAHALARGLAGSLGALWVTYGNFAGMAVGLAIGASLKGIVSVGLDVEHTLEGIRVRGNESVETMGRLRDVVLDLGRGVHGPQEVAKALETLVLAGLKAEQAASAVGAALNLATVGGTSIEKAASTLVSVGTAVGYTAEGFGRVGDVIAKTAALSMSSVESLSEAFKSASSVNQLYGISLEDIGTSLGVLSNLGIQGSAAGTALKNAFKELASESDKVKKTLKDIGLSSVSLKDASGNFLPLLDVVGQLDEGLKKLSSQEEKIAIARLTNERGMRLITQALAEYRKETNDGSNALQKFRENVENSYGFAAKGAVQMALTAKSQVESMFNTLKTSFAETFTQIQPEVIQFSTTMKSIFNSQQFKDSIAALARNFAALAVAVAENIGPLTKFVAGLLALRVALAVVPLLAAVPAVITAIATAYYSVISAMTAFAAGTLTLSAAFPPLLIVFGLVTAAAVLYNKAIGEDNAKAMKDAASYSKGYIDGLIKEADNLDKLNEKMKQKKTLAEANAELERDASRDLMIKLDKEAIAEAELNLKKAQGNFNQKATLDAINAVNKARERATNNIKLAAAAEQTLFEKAKLNKELVEKAKPANPPRLGEVTLSTNPDVSAENDRYAEAIQEQVGVIKAARRDLQSFEDVQNEKFRRGEIGRLELLETVAEKSKESYKKISDAIESQIGIAAAGKNKAADVERFKNDLERASDDLSSILKNNGQQTLTEIERQEKEAVRLKVKTLEDQGQFVQAATLRWSSDYSTMYAQIEADAKRGNKSAIEFMAQLDTLNKQLMASAGVKEASASFNLLAASMANIIKGVQTVNESQGLAGMFTAAVKATDEYKAKLPELEKALKAVRDAANAPGASDQDKKKYEDAVTKQKDLAQAVKTMWSGVGESISKSLESAFGKSGKAAASMLKTMIDYNNTDNKSVAAKNKLYGDLAQGAAGFFDEQSKGYKALQAVSQAFHLVQMAQLVTENIALGIKAVLTQGSGDPYTAWGRMAAMAAVVAGLGVVIGGVSGGGANVSKDVQASQGSGSVLGDSEAKSESISKALEIIAKDSGLGLVHSQQSVNYLKSISENISGLAAAIARTAGIASGDVPNVKEGTSISTNLFTGLGPAAGLLEKIPLVGSVLKKLFGVTTSVVDQGIILMTSTLKDIQETGQLQASTYATVNTKKSFFGVSYSNKTKDQLSTLDSEVTNQFGLIIDSLANSVVSAANVLGVGGDAFTKHLQTFVVDIGKISFKDMTGDEIEKALQAVFSKLGDEMAAFGVAGLSEFQKVGEGYFETLSRIANDLIQVKDVFAILGKELNATGLEAVRISEGLISAAGGIEKLTEGAQFFMENFMSDADKLEVVSKSLNAEMGRLGVSNVDTIKEFYDLVQAQDLTTKAGQEMYAALMNVAPAFKTVQDLSEKTVEKQKDIASKQRALDIQLLEAQGKTAEALAAKRKDELDALAKLNPTLAETQKQIWILTDATNAYKATKNLEAQLLDLQGNKAEALNITRGFELEGLSETDKLIKLRIYALQDEATALSKANATAQLNAQILDLQGNKAGALAITRQIEMQSLSESDKILKLRIYALQDEATKLQALYSRGRLYVELLTLEGEKATALALTREMELAGLTDSEKAIKRRIYALQDEASAIDKLKGNASSSFAVLEKSIGAAKNAAQALYDGQKEALDARKDAAKTTYENFEKVTKASIDTATKANSAIADLSSSLSSTLNQMLENTEFAMKRSTAQDIISKALDTAKASGVLPKAEDIKDALSTLTKTDTNDYSSYVDYARDIGVTAGKISQLNDITKGQKSNSDLQLEALNKSLEIAKASYDKELEQIEKQDKLNKDKLDSELARFDLTLQVAKDQLDIMNGTYVAVKSMSDAFQSFNTAVTAAIKAMQSSGQTAVNEAIPKPGQNASPPKVTDSEITELYSKLLGRTPDAAGFEFWKKAAARGESLGNITAGFMNSPEYMKIHGSHANGLDDVPMDGYIAKLHKGEMVLPASSAQSVRSDVSNADIVEAIEKLCADNSAENQSMVSNISFIKKLLQNSSPEGDNINVKIVTE